MQLGQARQAAAQGGEVAWSRGGERYAGEDALQIAHAAQGLLQRRACGGLAQRGDGLIAAAQRVLVAQRALHPAAQQPAAHRRLGAIQHGGQRVVAAAAQIGLEFQIAPCGRIQQQAVLGLLDVQGPQVGQGAALGVLDIAEQRPGGGDAGIEVFGPEAAEIVGPELLAEPGTRAGRVEMPERAAAQGAMRGPGRQHDEILRDQQLGRAQPFQFRQPVGFARGFEDAESPAREIQPGERVASAVLVERGEQVVAARFQQRLVGDRAGSDDAADAALDRPLARRGRADLLADHRRFAEPQQPREITFQRVVWHPGHGDGHARRFTAMGERQIQQRRPAPRVLEEQLVEVPHAIEQQVIRMLGLDAQVLLHHGRVAIERGGGRGGRRWVHEGRRQEKRMYGARRLGRAEPPAFGSL